MVVAKRGASRSPVVGVTIPLFFFALVAPAAELLQPLPAHVKVATVRMLAYDKTDVPRPDYDPTEAMVRFIQKATKDEAQLVVFPEYLLGRLSVPGPQTERISKPAVAGRIHVIVGCWEVYEEGSSHVKNESRCRGSDRRRYGVA
jgi:hypothetical protein